MTKKQKQAFDQLFQEAHTYCIKYLITLTKSKQDAEDAFMEAISRYWVYQQQGKIKHQTNIKAFVAVTAKRIWFENQRKKATTHEKISNFDERFMQQIEDQVNPHDVSDFDELIKKEMEQEKNADQQQKKLAFQKAFTQLGEKCQELLKGRFVYKIKGVELAKQLQLKNAAVVKTSITRCKQRFMSYYKLAAV